jgi:hypothetical protein
MNKISNLSSVVHAFEISETEFLFLFFAPEAMMKEIIKNLVFPNFTLLNLILCYTLQLSKILSYCVIFMKKK